MLVGWVRAADSFTSLTSVCELFGMSVDEAHQSVAELHRCESRAVDSAVEPRHVAAAAIHHDTLG